VQGQLAVDIETVLAVADAGGAEGHRRVGVGLEEVGRAEVVVALGVVGVDGGQLDGGGHRGGQRIRCQGEFALEAGEVAADLADHQVADGEGHIGVAGIDRVGPGDITGDLHGSGRRD
jgi:hypothetical protein